ncbi:hypothetical protein Tco_0393249 [Tanacetum coccineum]
MTLGAGATVPFRGNNLSTQITYTYNHPIALTLCWGSWDHELLGLDRGVALPSPVMRTEMPEICLPLRNEADCRYTSGRQELDDARHDQALLRARVNMLYRDRPFHRRTTLLMEEEARVSRVAWAQSLDACDQETVVISDLLKADHRRQRQLVEALKIVKSLKTQMIELQRQQGPAKDPVEPELPEEASSSS